MLVTDCPCLAEDMAKIWQVYWQLGDAASLPSSWSPALATRYNAATPLSLPSLPSVYLSSSPAALCPPGREVDLAAILRTIDSAEEFVSVAVMDYAPFTLYTPHTVFWPDIDNALRRAAIDRGVRVGLLLLLIFFFLLLPLILLLKLLLPVSQVKLLASQWAHTRPSILRFLRSLQDLAGDHPKVDIQVRTGLQTSCSFLSYS